MAIHPLKQLCRDSITAHRATLDNMEQLVNAFPDSNWKGTDGAGGGGRGVTTTTGKGSGRRDARGAQTRPAQGVR